VPNIITRRQFVATVATGTVLATGKTVRAQSGFLRWMGRWNGSFLPILDKGEQFPEAI